MRRGAHKEWVSGTRCRVLVTCWTCQSSCNVLAPPLGEGRRILAGSGRARMRPLGHMGTGEGSPRIRTPERIGGLYEQVVHLPAIPLQTIAFETPRNET